MKSRIKEMACVFSWTGSGPRGLTKEKASVDLRLKDIAPSTMLREGFGHDPNKWQEFKKCYHQELKEHEEQVSFLKGKMKKGIVTLVYGAKDEEHNEASGSLVTYRSII